MMGWKGRLAIGACLGLEAAFACILAPREADAAPKRRDEGPLFTQVDTGQQAAAEARALAAKGQCKKALDVFDRAILSSLDVTLRRDRGLCHEQLGHPFPAIDDYRAYLTAEPEAADAADIQARLERLERETGVGGPSAHPPSQKSSEDIPDEPALADETAPGTADTGRRKAIAKKTYDDEEAAYRKFDQAESSPLRRGTGGIFGIYSDVRGSTYRSNTLPSFEVGGSIRWSFSRLSTLYGQIGYVTYQESGLEAVGSSSAANESGFALGLGYEVRLRLDENVTNAILLGAVVEYQYVTQSVVNAALSLLLPEAKVGYRHIFGYGFGLELTGDLGTTVAMVSGGGVEGVVWGGSLALLLAF
jgi:tetratricopeptide (TPR) repeat protein